MKKITVQSILLSVLLLACQPVTQQSTASIADAPKAVFTKAKVNSMEEGLLLSSADHGQSWQAADQGLPENIMISDMEKLGEDIIISSDNLGLFKRAKNAESWKAIGDLLPGKKINALHVSDQNIYVGIYEKGIYRSPDQGNTWETLNYSLTDLRVQSILQIGEELIVGTDTGIFQLHTETKYWRPLFEGAQINSLNHYQGKIVAATHKGILMAEKLSGDWKWIHEKGAAKANVIDKGMILEISFDGTLYISRDWGKNWLTPMHWPYPGVPIYDLIALEDKLILSTRFGIMESQDDGMTWKLVTKYDEIGIVNLLKVGDLIYGGLWNPKGC